MTIKSRERTLRTWKAWQKEKVEVTRCPGTLLPEERETSLSFIGKEQSAEITTANYQWQKRIESLGVVPSHINVFAEGAEIRYYSKVPKSYIKLPSRGRK